MKTRICTLIMATLFIVSCGPNKNMASKEDLEQVNNLVKNDAFTIESIWAYPQNASLISSTGLLPPDNSTGNVNLVGNYNYFKKVGDSLVIDLPYFGVRQMGGAYDTDNAGFRFEGVPEETAYTFKEDKNVHQYNFELNKGTENLQFLVKIYTNLRTEIRVNSSHRTSIAYRGKVVLED